ncbi:MULTISPECIES: SMI1/KNR4 family protein [unclassified Sphingomonas]|uniref:SMI1/KNR4 family protein n=1 Tax=unclassified Sphingomonas TaxID=196159 RepID=UPI0006F913B1|nr:MULTISPECIES: SMI1/KNR4 family protein [unclassified Sphingomonas]KQM61307.1 hypothetical protein ASE65_07110 [Sphingomonas sp. Leaf16]KQN12402.1 hypothetical protein ASE81_08120 [Sphingomonas sp. Leaf29]KQN18883.1 hypothetical protein ASE83_08045 [Sphingomonas sp. Leaf32]
MFRRLLGMVHRGIPPIPKPDLSALSEIGDGPDRAWQRLNLWWQATGSDVTIGINSSVAVAALAERYDATLPADFQAYLLHGCPVAEETMDHELGTWWPLERIRNLLDEDGCGSDPELPGEGARYLLFADHLMWCWAWAISCEPGATYGHVVRVSDTIGTVAVSFTDFVERYTTDWQSIG